MILSDGDIEVALDTGHLVVEPLDDPQQQIQPASIDVRLGDKLKSRSDEMDMIDPLRLKNGVHEEYDIPETGYAIQPGEFVLGTTIERVEMPLDLLAQIQGRSSIGRLGITVHSTAGIIDPGYEGQITLELTNEGQEPVLLYPKMRIGQLIFKELKSTAQRGYGDDESSKYQGQEGPTPSRIDRDPDL